MADNDICCAVCGSLRVQYAVWHSPNTGEVGELFGSWNAGDNTFCADCDEEGRACNAPLVDKSVSRADAKEFRLARKVRERLDRGMPFEDARR